MCICGCMYCVYVCVCMCVCVYMYFLYTFEYILYVCRVFDLLHTYSSDTLAQGILKSFFAFTTFLMPLPRSEPVATNCLQLSGKHGMHSPNSLTI